MFERWGLFAYRHRRIVPIIVLLGILGLYAAFGLRLDGRLSQEGWDDPHSDSTLAASIEQDTFGRDSNGDVILLYRAEDGHHLDDPAIQSAALKHLEGLRQQHPDQIDHVTSYFDTHNAKLANADKTLAFAAIGLKGDGEQTLKDFRLVEEDLIPEISGVKTEVAGATAVADALDKGMAGDISRAEIYALPAVAVLLLIVFGSVVAAAMPLVVGVLSILGSLGVLSVLAGFVQVNVFAQSVVTLLGLGLAIDYGLFMVSRFREEMDRGEPIERAVATTTATAGKTVVFSAGMVGVALSGLLVFPQAFLKSVSYGAISAVGLAALLSVTVLPSLFGILGKTIDRWAVRRTSRRARRMQDTIWWKIPSFAMKYSKTVTLGICIVLLGLTLPLAKISFGGINETYLPPTNQVRQTQAQFDENFPEFRTEPIKLVVTNADNAQLVQVYQQANQVAGLTGRFSPSQATKEGTTVLSAGIADRKDNERVIQELRNLDVPDGVKVYIGGTPALEVESIEALFERLPWMAIYIVIATFILMSLVFGSMVLPAKAVIMTILGMGTTLGILTLMFVDGVGSGIFNFTPGPLMSPVLVLIVAIIYGLSTDYEVFLLSRMVEARDRGSSTDDAIRYGTAHTGGIITAAALIMIVVCGAFGFSEIVMMKYIAFGMIAALFLDATIIRMMLVPAVMHLLREDNWWAPRFVRRAYLALGHHEGASAPRLDKQRVGEANPQPKEPAMSVPAQPTVSENATPMGADIVATEEDAEFWRELPNRELSIDEVVVETHATRSGRSVQEDADLVPFQELMRRLEAEKRRELE